MMNNISFMAWSCQFDPKFEFFRFEKFLGQGLIQCQLIVEIFFGDLRIKLSK